MRSWLLIEANSPNKLGKAPLVGADAVVVDLTGIPSGDRAAEMRNDIAEWLKAHGDKGAFARWVRIKPLDAEQWREDLIAVMAGAPDGVVLPKASGPEQIRQLASEIYEIEQKLGLEHNSTKIIPQIGETPHAALTLSELTRDPAPRISGFTWNAESLAENVGAMRTHTDNGQWTDVMRYVRSNVLLLAKVMGVMAIDHSASDPADPQAGADAVRGARLDGFTGVWATNPRQVSAIHSIFSESDEEVSAEAEESSHYSSEKAKRQAAKLLKPVAVVSKPEPDLEPEESEQKFRAIV